MNIKTQLISSGTKRRSGSKINKVVFFVDHDTGNPNSTAQSNVYYFCNSANDDTPSAHAFIDDKGVIICIPCLDKPEKAWHVLYEKPEDNRLYGDDANDIAIGLELCYFPGDKIRTQKAYDNYIEFAAYLADYHKIEPSKRSGHFELDSVRKTDPNNALKILGKTYAQMKQDIVKKSNEVYGGGLVSRDQVAPWAKDPQSWVQENKISDGTRPGDFMQRQEDWTMQKRMYDIIDKRLTAIEKRLDEIEKKFK
ncbi:MAG: N-acetylmuramoyl-L-alanine amidase family protein [Vulcanibacillus sp.]